MRLSGEPGARPAGPDLFVQKLAEMPVDGQFAGQKLDSVLPFETAEIRHMGEIA
jgi:hypothetical protein